MMMLSHNNIASSVTNLIIATDLLFSFESVERDMGCLCSWVSCWECKDFKALTALSPVPVLGAVLS